MRKYLKFQLFSFLRNLKNDFKFCKKKGTIRVIGYSESPLATYLNKSFKRFFKHESSISNTFSIK